MTTYNEFRCSCLDLTILGLQDEPAVKNSPFPQNAQVLGWLTGRPVCFFQIPEQGQTVFASAANTQAEEQPVPVAEDIDHFIGLLVCCPDAALIAGAHQWSSFRFNELIGTIVPGMKAQSVIRALTNTYHPPVIADPGAEMAQLRKEYQKTVPPTDWEVGFCKEFLQPCSKGHSGKELMVNRCVVGEDGSWTVPSVFICDDGIVVDTYLEISAERLMEFRCNWADRNKETLSLPDKLNRQLEDPLTAAVTGILSVNDKRLRCKQSFTAVWNPFCDNTPQSCGIMNHYRLDPDRGYLFRRYCFLRKGKYPKIRSIELVLEATPVMVPGECFTAEKNGTHFQFINPCTGMEHRFTALELSNEALNPNFLTNHPCFYKKLTYALEPSISPENFRVVDREPGDPWEGYQDDPAAVIYANRKPAPGRYALSSLHYEPREQVLWQMIFRKKIGQDIHFPLIP